MSTYQTKPPGHGFGAGHTAQYITLAEGLRQTVEAMEADLAYVETKEPSLSLASLRFEARCATIAVLAAALCECAANTVLATVLTPADFQLIEKEQMPRKWSREIPKALHSAPPNDSIVQELWDLHQTRNTIVHAKATIFADSGAVHIQGTDPQWAYLTPSVVRKFYTLPLRVAETIPAQAGITYHSIPSALRERQARIPRVHVEEVLQALELITIDDRMVIREALDALDAKKAPCDVARANSPA